MLQGRGGWGGGGSDDVLRPHTYVRVVDICSCVCNV